LRLELILTNCPDLLEEETDLTYEGIETIFNSFISLPPFFEETDLTYEGIETEAASHFATSYPLEETDLTYEGIETYQFLQRTD